MELERHTHTHMTQRRLVLANLICLAFMHARRKALLGNLCTSCGCAMLIVYALRTISEYNATWRRRNGHQRSRPVYTSYMYIWFVPPQWCGGAGLRYASYSFGHADARFASSFGIQMVLRTSKRMLSCIWMAHHAHALGGGHCVVLCVFLFVYCGSWHKVPLRGTDEDDVMTMGDANMRHLHMRECLERRRDLFFCRVI